MPTGPRLQQLGGRVHRSNRMPWQRQGWSGSRSARGAYEGFGLLGSYEMLLEAQIGGLGSRPHP